MRAVQLAFKGTVHPVKFELETLANPQLPDDMPILIAAREQVRAGFLEKRGLNPSDNDTTVAIRHAEDVAKILRENVVQGKQAEGKENTYSKYTLRRSSCVEEKSFHPADNRRKLLTEHN